MHIFYYIVFGEPRLRLPQKHEVRRKGESFAGFASEGGKAFFPFNSAPTPALTERMRGENT